jgi:hypothetical protein
VALVGLRVEKQVLQDLPDASEFGIGLNNIVLETEYWDNPNNQGSLIIKQTRSSVNANGIEQSREIDEWHYEEPTEFPVWLRKETWQYCWIPKINHRASLVLVQVDTTTYWYETGLVASNPSFRRLKEGYVVYNLAPTAYVVDADGQAIMDAKGQKQPAGPTRKIPGTQRAWSSGITQQGIVERPDENQGAYWENIELEHEIVKEDSQRLLRWGFKHDYLTGKTESTGPEETRKDPESWSYPLKPTAPDLKAHDKYGVSVVLEIAGGDAEVQTPTFSPLAGAWLGETRTQMIPVGSYVIFRKQTVAPTTPETSDRFGIIETPPAYDDTTMTMENTDVEDYAGNPASAVPSVTPYTEPEDATPQPVPFWEQIDEIANAITEPGKPSAATYEDTRVDDGATYEYYCVATIANEGGPDSNHVTIQHRGGTRYSSIKQNIIQKPDGSTVIDNQAPPDPQLKIPYPQGCIGETQTYEVPAKLDDDFNDGEEGTWPSSLLADAQALGTAIAMRNFLRETKRLVGEVDTPPLLLVERGEQAMLPAMTHETWGSDIHLTTELNKRDWRIEGFDLRASKTDAGFTTSFMLFLEEIV